MTQLGDTLCPVCAVHLNAPVQFSKNALIRCPNCGDYQLTGSADAELEGKYSTPDVRARIAYAISRLPPLSVVNTTLLAGAATIALPRADEMIDNVVIELGKEPPGTSIDLWSRYLRAIAGAQSEDAATWVLLELVALKFIRGPQVNLGGFGMPGTQLTSEGWSHHRKLMLEGAGSRHAFMAMKYGDPQLDSFVSNHLRPAVEQTGFDLRRLDDAPEAGLIDNRLRVEIRRSRFLICDLSHGNRGAYWEAGFAEGIGRPVIYLCREDVFIPGHEYHPHFDTNHQTIIKWNAADPANAARLLKDMIRATLPHEARLEDERRQ